MKNWFKGRAEAWGDWAWDHKNWAATIYLVVFLVTFVAFIVLTFVTDGWFAVVTFTAGALVFLWFSIRALIDEW